MASRRVEGLPHGPAAAAAHFYARELPAVEAALDEDLVLIFPPAGYEHRGWRLAAVQDLARARAPLRVNAVAGEDVSAIAAAVAYLDLAQGVTGQYLPLDGQGAGVCLHYTR